jgi:hypothetical protein
MRTKPRLSLIEGQRALDRESLRNLYVSHSRGGQTGTPLTDIEGKGHRVHVLRLYRAFAHHSSDGKVPSGPASLAGDLADFLLAGLT